MAVVRNSPGKILEVKDASDRLGLASDLKKWSKEDVQKWILWAIREYYSLCLDLLEIDGKELIGLNLSNFQSRVPDLSVFFYNELQIWRKASTENWDDDNDIELNEEALPTYVVQYSDTPPRTPTTSVLTPRSPATSVHIPRSPATSVLTPKSPTTSVHTSRSPATSVLTSRSPATSVLTPRSPATSVLTPRSPATSVLTPRSPATSVLTPISPATSVHTPRSPATSVLTPSSNTVTCINAVNVQSSTNVTEYNNVTNVDSEESSSLSRDNPNIYTEGPQHDKISTPITDNKNPMLSITAPKTVSPTTTPLKNPFKDIPITQSTPLPTTPSQFLFSPHHHPLAHPQMALLSPMSPHILGQTPRLFIPPPTGFTLPFPGSPAALLPQSPFRSPLITPDVHSPHFNSLPHMEALRENIIRLEKQRKKHALSLEKGGEKLKNRRLNKKQNKMRTLQKQKSDSCMNEGEGSLLNKSGDSSGAISVTIPADVNKIVCKSEKDCSPRENTNFKLDKNSNMKVIGSSSPHSSSPKEKTPQQYNDNTSDLISNKTLDRQLSYPLNSKGYINIEPICTTSSPVTPVAIRQNMEPVGTSPVTPVAVRQNSYQIPYYQATSLQSYDRQNSDLPTSQLLNEDLHNKTRSDQISPINLSLSRPESSVNESYSPISSPSDTEVDGEHPLFQQPHNIPHPIYNLGCQSSSSTSTSYTQVDTPIISLPYMQPPLLPDVLNNLSQIADANDQQIKSPKKRGRPPGTKPMQRPLGPTDIQKSFFRANHLWKFLLEMLEHPQQFGTYIQWLDRPQGVFKIINSAYVASLWGKRKNNGRMTYDKFSRSIRQYYKKGIIIKTKPSKLIYKFGAEFFNPNGQ